MKQKLVIRTNVKPATVAQSVSYEWHWRRIWAALLSFGVVIGAGAYALQVSVNADEVQELQVASLDDAQLGHSGAGTQTLELHSSDTENSQQDVFNAESEGGFDRAQDNLTETIMVDVESAYNEDNGDHSEASGDDAQPLSAEPIDAPTNTQDSTQNQDTSLDDASTESITEDVSEAYQEESSANTEVVSQKQFAQDANIANVALGAKIDTAKISRAVLTTRVVDKEPVDVLKSDVSNTQFNEKIYFFTEVKNLQGNTIHHLWYYQDVLQADIALTISAARYRTYSLKHVNPEQTGDWRVEAVTENGDLLAKKEFRIHAAKP